MTSPISWISVKTGTPSFFLIIARSARPFLIPGPRKPLPEVRLALSYDDLKTKGIPNSSTMALIVLAVFKRNSVPSITQGPAMTKNFPFLPN